MNKLHVGCKWRNEPLHTPMYISSEVMRVYVTNVHSHDDNRILVFLVYSFWKVHSCKLTWNLKLLVNVNYIHSKIIGNSKTPVIWPEQKTAYFEVWGTNIYILNSEEKFKNSYFDCKLWFEPYYCVFRSNSLIVIFSCTLPWVAQNQRLIWYNSVETYRYLSNQLQGWTIGVQFLAKTKTFIFLTMPRPLSRPGSGVHPTS